MTAVKQKHIDMRSGYALLCDVKSSIAKSIMRAAIYARVSTNDQTNTIQVGELKEYIERRGWEVAGIYQDQMSGAKASRPGLNHLIADARLRTFAGGLSG